MDCMALEYQRVGNEESMVKNNMDLLVEEIRMQTTPLTMIYRIYRDFTTKPYTPEAAWIAGQACASYAFEIRPDLREIGNHDEIY